jgi:hypothetical protein
MSLQDKVLDLILKISNICLILDIVFTKMPISEWTVIRNYFYTFYILFFITIAFGIIIRKNIFNSGIIPILVVNLIITTFSFAIAGLINDSLAFLHL